MLFILKGSVGIGYRLFNEIFYGMRIVMSINKKIISPINDYSCLNNKNSEFLYTPIDKIEAYGIRKEYFNELLSLPIAKKIRKKITLNYAEVIQEPLHEHREEMARNFENRIDYVDIEAYGVGKVKINDNRPNFRN